MSAISVSNAVDILEEILFVGRERELASFRQWLFADTPTPELLNVCGPGGVGKTSLLSAFQRIAGDVGRPVVFANGANFPATPHGLIQALGGSVQGGLHDVVARLNEASPLILLDAFDEIAELTGYLREELLPRLQTSAKVVIAGRYPLGLAWSENSRWHKIIRPMPLGSFTETEGHEYLNRRGLVEPKLIKAVIDAAGNSPLALSLAADLALQFGVRDFSVAPEWRLVVRSLVERLLREVKDPQLRSLLEACAVIRQFDEVSLASISGQENVGAAFDRLCRLAVVRPTEHGLMVHDDVRRFLVEDLAWRHPKRYEELRARALAYYRQRLQSAVGDDREWLVAERLFLWGNALIRELFFAGQELGLVWVEPATPADHAEIRLLFSTRMAHRIPPDVIAGVSTPAEEDEFLDTVLRYPGTRLRVARHRDGRTAGFTAVLPICAETVPLLELHPAYAPLIHTCWSPADLAALPAAHDATSIYFFLPLVYGGESPAAVRAALLRDLFGVFAGGGTYLCAAYVPAHKQMLEACGFECLPGVRNNAYGPDYSVDVYVLDLSRIGFEPWIEAVMSGRRPPRLLDARELEVELQHVFRHWHDDGQLARSRLLELTDVSPTETNGQRATALRERILQALANGRAQASAPMDAAYRAVELTYLSRRPSHKGGARSLAVSRATLYRLVKRGIRGLAEALARPSTRLLNSRLV